MKGRYKQSLYHVSRKQRSDCVSPHMELSVSASASKTETSSLAWMRQKATEHGRFCPVNIKNRQD